ncbi:MAG TPA: hypothetical protein VFN81_08640 [Sphingomicrobium sp.]|nr:hypothetical protein [Sphingomicrobium sp.]
MDSMMGAEYYPQNQDPNDPTNAAQSMPQQQPSTPPPSGHLQGTEPTAGMLIDQEVVDLVTSRLKASEEWRNPYRLEWDQATDHYEQIYDATGKESWQATTFQPLIPTHVERATASLHNMSMGPETPVEYKARNPENEFAIENTNELIQHDLERGQFKVHWTDFLRSAALYGTGIGKVGYMKETAQVMVKERKRPLFNGLLMNMKRMFGFDTVDQSQETFQQQTMLVKDYASFKNTDIYKIYPQPHIDDFTKDTWVIEKFKISNRELVEGAFSDDDFYRLDNVTPELLVSGNTNPDNDPQTQQKRLAQGDMNVSQPDTAPDLQHEGLEYWGPVPLYFLDPSARNDEVRKYLTVNAWIWVIDGRWVVRNRMNPYSDSMPPYIKGNYVRRPGQFYGIGIGKILCGLQIEKNEIRNTRQDNINLILNKVMAVLKDKVAKEDFQRLVSGPGALWPFQGIDDVRKALFPIEFPDITADSWRGSAEVDREAQEATDVVKTTQTIGAGEDQAGNGTFRGQLLNQQTANERFMLIARILEIVGLNAAIEKIYSRIYQFKSFDQIDAILGQARSKKFQLIQPEQLPEIASLISLGALTNENKGVKLAQMRDFWMLMMREPWFKKIEYARKMYRLMNIGSDPDEILWTDQEVAQYNDIKRQMLAASGGMPLPNAGNPGEPNGPGNPGQPPSGLGSPPSGPIAGNVPGPTNGLPRPSMPAAGPGASSIDGIGRPAA